MSKLAAQTYSPQFTINFNSARMKKITYILIVFTVLNFSYAKAQEYPETIDQLAQRYTSYFKLDREVLFLHLNKTVLAPKEDVWFSAYSFYQKNFLAASGLTSVRVGLYDGSGELLQEKELSLKDGLGEGSFDLEPYLAGKYRIKASIVYMDDLRENLAFSQGITILGDNQKDLESLKYNTHVLPEGGHLLANAVNTLGVKLVDGSGLGVAFTKGEIIDGSGSVVKTFKSNRFGLAKFRFVPQYSENYTAVLTTKSGEEVKKTISESDIVGLTMSVNTMLPKRFVFSIKTNKKTYGVIKNNKFYLVYHRAGKMKGLEFTIPASLSANINIAKEDLYPGMNIVTIFDQDMKPLLERLVFNWKGVKRKDIEAVFKGTERNSLVIDLSTTQKMDDHTMSVSVLPSGTKAYHPRNNIFSTFYIEPYIKGNLQHGSYYFSQEVNKRRRNYDLNLLLVTQGWSKYVWGYIFKNDPTGANVLKTHQVRGGTPLADREEKLATIAKAAAKKAARAAAAMAAKKADSTTTKTATVVAVAEVDEKAVLDSKTAAGKEHYKPDYNSYSSPDFTHYGVVDWFPSVSLESNGKTTLKVINTLQPGVLLYIEGMTKKGALISEEIKISTPQ